MRLRLPDPFERLSTGLLRTDAPNPRLVRIWRRQSPVAGHQHVLRRCVGRHWRCCRQSLFPYQDPPTELLTLLACGNPTYIPERCRRSAPDLLGRGHIGFVPRRRRCDDSDRIWQLGAAANILLCEEEVDETYGYGRGSGAASFQQRNERFCGLLFHAPTW